MRGARRGWTTLLLTLAFLAGTGRGAFGLHECPHHLGGTGGHGAHAAHGPENRGADLQEHPHHHHHGGPTPSEEPESPPPTPPHHGEGGPCTCLGDCTTAGSPGALPDEARLASVPPSRVDPAPRHRSVWVGPRHLPWERPPATAPPPHLRVAPGD